MIARGPLKHCVRAALHAFHVQHYPMLSVLHNHRSSYYTTVTEDDLGKLATNLGDATHRLVFRGTENELILLCATNQLDLMRDGGSNAPSSSD